jgi:hypothetical protein
MNSLRPCPVVAGRGSLLVVAVTGLLLVCLSGAASDAAGGPASEMADLEAGGRNGMSVTELLSDRRFEKGVRPPTNGSNIQGPGKDCLERWEKVLPSTARAAWQFVTVAETTRFCDNPDTPSVEGARIVYSSKDSSKRFEIDRKTGEIRFVYDTEHEWRHGCNLSRPEDGVEPRYLSGRAWNWPHFLLNQRIEDPDAPDGKLRLDNYHELTFQFDAELVRSAKGEPAQCPPGTWGDQVIPDHCLFYLAFVMARQIGGRAAAESAVNPEVIYALYPLFYSNGGERYDEACIPWLGDDPARNAVYFTPNHVCLGVGRRVEVLIDAHALAAESVGAINQRHGAGLSADGYYIHSVLIGWEVWGAYRSDIRLSGLSFGGRHYDAAPSAPLYERFNPVNGDHMYATALVPEGCEGYELEKEVGRIPVCALANTRPLYEYWSPEASDHYYSTDCLPFGFLGYVFQGRIGYVFEEQTDPACVPLYQYYSAERTDHRYAAEHHPQGYDSYAYEKVVGYIERAGTE